MNKKVLKPQLRMLQKGDVEKLVDIYRDVIGVDLGRHYWEWKYFKNPFCDSFMSVAFDGDRVVGETGGIPCQIKVGHKEFLGMQIVDIIILAEYRKGGTFFKLMKMGRLEAKKHDRSLSYAISIKKTYKISTRWLRFRGVFPIKRFVNVLDPSPYLKKKMGALGGLIGGAGRVGLSAFRPGRLSVDKGLSVEDVKVFDKRFDEFWQRAGKSYNIAVVRDSKYLTWRYTECPIHTYNVFAATSGERLEGYIICSSATESGVKKGRIVDLFVEKGNCGAAGTLINRAMDWFREDGCALVVTWGHDGWWLGELFTKANFTVKDTPHDLIVRSASDDLGMEYLAKPENWCFGMGDSDYF